MFDESLFAALGGEVLALTGSIKLRRYLVALLFE